MHVALVGDHPLPGELSRGGVQRVVEVLRREIARTVRVTLFVPSTRKALRHQDKYGEIIYLGRPPGPGFLSYWSVTSFAVFQEIKRLQPDIIHVQDVAGLALFWPFREALRCPMIFTAHGVLEADLLYTSQRDNLRRATAALRSKIVGIVERRSRKLYDSTIVINDYVLEAMPDVIQRRHHFIPNPIDDVFFKVPTQKPKQKPELVLIQVGVISPLKNILGSVRIAAELIAMGHPVRLGIIGPVSDNGYYTSCLEEIRHLNLETAVTFHGSLSPEEVACQMDKADLLILPSKQEMAPMVIAEAHCRGLPVAGPRAFGVRSMISEGKDGIFLDGPGAREDAESIAALLAKEPDREAIRANARTTYELKSVIDRTLSVYREALESRSFQTLPAVMTEA